MGVLENTTDTSHRRPGVEKRSAPWLLRISPRSHATSARNLQSSPRSGRTDGCSLHVVQRTFSEGRKNEGDGFLGALKGGGLVDLCLSLHLIKDGSLSRPGP